jgi:membrane-bound serine protease (ClpP class)
MPMKKLFLGVLAGWILIFGVLGSVSAAAPAEKGDVNKESDAVKAEPAKETLDESDESVASPKVSKVYVIPIREDIMPPLTYLVRRGVKAAMDADADVLIVDLDTFGGSIAVTLEIMDIISKFEGETITFINSKAI